MNALLGQVARMLTCDPKNGPSISAVLAAPVAREPLAHFL
jgi:hypothetical protein